MVDAAFPHLEGAHSLVQVIAIRRIVIAVVTLEIPRSRRLEAVAVYRHGLEVDVDVIFIRNIGPHIGVAMLGVIRPFVRTVGRK